MTELHNGTENLLISVIIALLLTASCGDASHRKPEVSLIGNETEEEREMTSNNPLIDPKVSSRVFFPRKDMPFGPEARGARDHLFEVEGGVRLRLRLFFADRQAPVILFFHGNGETARDYDPLADVYRALPASFCVAEYRGYGPSTGTPSLSTFLKDAHRTLDELLALLAKEQRTGSIVVMGRSLGSAPAIELAANRAQELSGLIIESGFARLVPLLELVGVPARTLGVKEEHGPGNQKKMSLIALPTLIMHAEDDEIIPIEDAVLLNQASGDPERIYFTVPRAGHNDIQARAGETYFERIAEILKRIR